MGKGDRVRERERERERGREGGGWFITDLVWSWKKQRGTTS